METPFTLLNDLKKCAVRQIIFLKNEYDFD